VKAAPALAIENRGEPLLEVTELGKSFPARDGAQPVRAVDGVSFAMAPGESLGLVGASGAGKSTVARMVVGLERPDRGHIVLEGRAAGRGSRSDRVWRGRLVHLILQDPYEALPAHLSVRSIIAEPARIHGGAGCLPAEEALEAVGLAPRRFLDRYPHTLSGGERQRVALARALVLRPRLIVADEPTSLLDVSRRRALLDVMREAGRRYGTAYLYITHDLGLAEDFCDRLLVMNDGRLVDDLAVADLRERSRHPYTAALVAAAASLYGSLSAAPGSASPS
jgi:ABC-type glutathione transport system ATPase component